MSEGASDDGSAAAGRRVYQGLSRGRVAMAVLAVAASIVAALPSSARAQAAEGPSAPQFASPFLPVDQWAVEALRRLDALGLAPDGFDPATGSLTRRQAAAAFRAASAAPDPGLAALARDWATRFAEEFPATMAALEDGGAPGVALLGGDVSAAGDARRGEVATGRATPDGWAGPAPLDDRTRPELAAAVAAAVFPHVVVAASPRWTPDGVTLGSGEAQLVAGDVAVWGGRRAQGYRVGRAGGIVLSGSAALDGGGLFLVDPVRIPYLSRLLGPIRFETSLSRLGHNGDVVHPWFWTARGTLRPHPRLSLGLSRGMFIGGDNNLPLTLRTLTYALTGKKEDFVNPLANSVVAVDVRYRPPLPVPILLYMEWGAEDSAGAWRKVPGRVLGLELPAVPGVPTLALGLEHAYFAGQCCFNPPWYHHGEFTDGWTNRGEPLGHPMGGEGTEWRLYGDAELAGARLRLGADAFVRNRGPENLFAPEREGGSGGGRVEVAWRAWPGLELTAEFAGAAGDGWSVLTGSMGVRMFLLQRPVAGN